MVEHAGDPCLSAGAEAIEHRPADEGALGAIGKRLEHVLAGADAAIEEDFGAVADDVDDLGQHADGGRRAVELAAAMIGHDHRIGTVIDGSDGIIGIEHALDDHRTAEALLDPFHVGPVQGRIEL